MAYKDLGFDPFLNRNPYERKTIDTILEDETALVIPEISASRIKGGVFRSADGRIELDLTSGKTTLSDTVVRNKDGSQLFSLDTENGWVNIGTPQPISNLDPNTIFYITRDADSYFAINFNNINAGTYASTELILFNDVIPTFIAAYGEVPSTGFIDMGVSSSTYADPDFAMFDASSEYLWCADNLYLGTAGENTIYFFAGGVDSKDYIQGSVNYQGYWSIAPAAGRVGFYGATPVAKQTGVAVSAAGIHAALVNLGLIGA